MTKRQIAAAIAAAGLKPGRIIPAAERARNERIEPWVIHRGAVATCRHGIAWIGDLDLDHEAHLLRGVALEIDESLYVVDEAGRRLCAGTGPSRALIREAVWWSQIRWFDRDTFLGIRHYEAWHPRRRRSREQAALIGRNWETRVVFTERACKDASWVGEVSQAPGCSIRPVMLHRSGAYELVWFSNGCAVLQPAFDRIRERCGDVSFSTRPGKAAISVHKRGRLVALLWPLNVPNRETAAAGKHELALRILPGARHELIALVIQHLRSAVHGSWEDLWRAVNRLLDAFEGRQDWSHVSCLPGMAMALLAGRREIAEIARFATTLSQSQRRRLGLPRKKGTRAFYQVPS